MKLIVKTRLQSQNQRQFIQWVTLCACRNSIFKQLKFHSKPFTFHLIAHREKIVSSIHLSIANELCLNRIIAIITLSVKLFVVIEHETHWILFQMCACREVNRRRTSILCLWCGYTSLHVRRRQPSWFLLLRIVTSLLFKFFGSFYLQWFFLVFVVVRVRFCSSVSFVLLW